MIKTEGNLLGFFERPVAAVLGVATLLLWTYLIVAALKRARRDTAAREGQAS